MNLNSTNKGNSGLTESVVVTHTDPCSSEVLSRYGDIVYANESLSIAILKTDVNLEDILSIDGVSSAYVERIGSLD